MQAIEQLAYLSSCVFRRNMTAQRPGFQFRRLRACRAILYIRYIHTYSEISPTICKGVYYSLSYSTRLCPKGCRYLWVSSNDCSGADFWEKFAKDCTVGVGRHDKRFITWYEASAPLMEGLPPFCSSASAHSGKWEQIWFSLLQKFWRLYQRYWRVVVHVPGGPPGHILDHWLDKFMEESSINY